MSLKKWFKEEWVDISRPKKGGGYAKCGRGKAKSSKYPKCVPKAKAARMTAAQKKSRIAQKKRLGQPAGKPRRVASLRRKKTTRKKA